MSVRATRYERVAVVVLDGVGIGGAPDADAYGDGDANSLVNTARSVGGLRLPNLAGLGLGFLGSIEGVPAHAEVGTAHGALQERSAGKDSAAGHWEMAGLVQDVASPTFPEGFPATLVAQFESAIGRKVLGNRAASGTDILEDLGEEHLRTGCPIVYTSADSVFQLAAHEAVIAPAQLYQWARVARRLLTGECAVGRVIARPFTGQAGAFVRSAGRRDVALPPSGPTLLDRLQDKGVATLGVGKIGDLFAGQGLRQNRYATSDRDAVATTIAFLHRPGPSLVFSNLVDIDTKYGHRNDPAGYALGLELFDEDVPRLREALGQTGLLMITGDHGCDPTTPSTDHTRERTPLLIAGIAGGPVDVGVRAGFGDLGATVAEIFGAAWGLHGVSFAPELGLTGE